MRRCHIVHFYPLASAIIGYLISASGTVNLVLKYALITLAVYGTITIGNLPYDWHSDCFRVWDFMCINNWVMTNLIIHLSCFLLVSIFRNFIVKLEIIFNPFHSNVLFYKTLKVPKLMFNWYSKINYIWKA